MAASVESLFRLIPSPEYQRELYQVLERIHPADARTFMENLLPYDVECYDKLDLNSSPDVWGGIDPSYVPNDIDILHELHGPNFCGVLCELHGRFAPMDGELFHAMNDLANYDPGPGKIPPESCSMMVMSDFADAIDAELGEPSLPSGAHLNMPDLDNVELHRPYCAEARWRCRISPVTWIQSLVGPPCRRGFTQT